MLKSTLAVASMLALGLALTGAASNAAHSSLSVKLLPVGNSKVGGSAEISQMMTIPEKPPTVSVSVKLEGQFIPEDKWPIDIHAGSCDHTNPKIAFALKPAVGGKSETHLENLTVGKLLGEPRFSIEVHNPKNTAVMACGFIDVPR